MTATLGIHDHPTRKLGRRPPSNKPALMLGQFLKAGVAPAHPATGDHFKQLPFGLYENDKFGDCGPTSVANLVRLVSGGLTGTEVQPSQDDVFDLYRRSGNPNFDPATDADDNGVDMQTMLGALLAGGIGDGKGNKIKPLAFAKVDVSSDDQLTAAVSIFGGVLWGVDLQVSQQTQTDAHPAKWDYHQSGEWGGHAIVNGAYEAGALEDVISWGQRIETTQAFRRHQLQEAWVVVWQWNVDHPAFQAGVDLQALAAAYKSLTGRDHAVPSPTPAPTPRRPDADATLWAATKAWAGQSHSGDNAKAAAGAQGLGGRQAPVSESRARDISASRNFCTRPTAVSGSSDGCATKIVRGTLKRASWSAAERDQLVDGRLRAAARNDPRARHLAHLQVRNPDHVRLQHLRVRTRAPPRSPSASPSPRPPAASPSGARSAAGSRPRSASRGRPCATSRRR